MANKTRLTLVHKVPSATFHYTYGDSYVYLDFVDRNRQIKYKVSSPQGARLIQRLDTYGTLKITNPV